MRDRATFWGVRLLVTVLGAVGIRPCAAQQVRRPVELQGHKGHVYTIALSPDGKLAATGGLDGTVRLWDAATGKQRALLLRSGESVASAAFSPDGRLVAVSCDEHRVYLWDARTGKERDVLAVDNARPVKLAFSPDGRLLACACADRQVRLWDLVNGKRRPPLETGESAWSVAFSPNGRLIAAGEWEGVVRVWEAASGKLLHAQKGHVQRVTVVFSPDGRVLASAGADGRLRLWDVRTGKERAVTRPHAPHGISSIAFLPEGGSLATAGWDGAVLLSYVGTGKEWTCLFPHRGGTTALAVSGDGRRLASGGGDGVACVWDLPARPPDDRVIRLAPGKLVSLWEGLKGDSGHALHEAVWALARSPRHSVPFLRERLRPVPRLRDPDRLDRLVAELDAKRFAVRERATRELAEAGYAAAAPLRRALDGKPSAELRRRAEELLARLRRELGGGAALRELWAVEVLEHAGTAEARALLRELARGADGHPLTVEAKTSLRRLERRAESKP